MIKTTHLQILVADDNEANQLIAKTVLERAGHDVVTVEHGVAALDVLRIRQFDLILLDIMMPVLDGMRTLRRIRREFPTMKDVPIFALTAFCSADDQNRYCVAGFDAVLSKPLRPGDLKRALEQRQQDAVIPRPAIQAAPLVSTTPLLDDAVIAQLRHAGDPDRLATIQAKFWASIGEQCDHMKKSLPDALRGDSAFLSQFRRAVHAVKGASASMGLQRSAAIARRLQNAPPADIGPLMRQLADSLSDSRPALADALTAGTARQFNAAVKVG